MGLSMILTSPSGVPFPGGCFLFRNLYFGLGIIGQASRSRAPAPHHAFAFDRRDLGRHTRRRPQLGRITPRGFVAARQAAPGLLFADDC